jgi:hypothetical protein
MKWIKLDAKQEEVLSDLANASRGKPHGWFYWFCKIFLETWSTIHSLIAPENFRRYEEERIKGMQG